MKIPVIQGVIRRRLLLNYRVSPDVVRGVIPSNFEPKLVDGFAIAGVCLIRLECVRPRGLPGFLGIASENSAHRFAVTWEDEAGKTQDGVFVSRRDTDSRLNALAGGRIFPGVHHHSAFHVADDGRHVSIVVEPGDADAPLVDVVASESDEFPLSSVFPSLAHASRFFEVGCLGYSSRPHSDVLDGLKLDVTDWEVSPLKVEHVRTSFFDDPEHFPQGTIQFDHALLMRNCAHEWHSVPMMMAEPAVLVDG